MWTWQPDEQLLQLRVPIRWLGWRCASGTCALAQLPRLPALLKCGFREMAPRPPGRRRSRIAGMRLTRALLAECVPTLGVYADSPWSRALGQRVVSAQGACRCVCACGGV